MIYYIIQNNDLLKPNKYHFFQNIFYQTYFKFIIDVSFEFAYIYIPFSIYLALFSK